MIDKWKTKAVALAKQMRADKRDAETTRADGKGTERLQDVDATVRLQRPAEPPVGTFSRVDRTDRLFYRFPTPSLTSYFHLTCDAGDRPWAAWMDITEPGDTITKLRLVEVPDWSWVADE